jgi:hypothetical protein
VVLIVMCFEGVKNTAVSSAKIVNKFYVRSKPRRRQSLARLNGDAYDTMSGTDDDDDAHIEQPLFEPPKVNHISVVDKRKLALSGTPKLFEDMDETPTSTAKAKKRVGAARSTNMHLRP